MRAVETFSIRSFYIKMFNSRWMFQILYNHWLTDMNLASHGQMYEDAQQAPDGSNARLKPHAQVHLLSPTDKCKVTSQVWRCPAPSDCHTSRSATSRRPNTSTTVPWLASAAEHSSGGPFRTRQQPHTSAGDLKPVRSIWGQGKTVNTAGNKEAILWVKNMKILSV